MKALIALGCASLLCLTGCDSLGGVTLSGEQGQLSISRAADGSLIIITTPPIVQESKK